MKNANIDLNKDKKNKDTKVAALAHVLGFLTGVFGPIIIYILSDDEFAKRNAARAITWQIFFTLYMFISIFMMFFFLGLFMIPVIALADLIFSIVATSKALDGIEWKYPLTTDLFVDSQSQDTHVDKNFQDTNNKDADTRIEELKQMYLNGEISETEFEKLVDANLSKEKEKEDLDLSYEK